MYPIGTIIQRPLKEKGLKRPLSLFYKHVGIYVGNDDVIHFSPKDSSEPKNKATIIKTSLDEFANGKKIGVRKKPKDLIHGKAICEEAERIYCNPGEYKKKYNPFSRNCEDFAKHCYEVKGNKYGLTQIIWTILSVIGSGIMAIIGFVFKRNKKD